MPRFAYEETVLGLPRTLAGWWNRAPYLSHPRVPVMTPVVSSEDYFDVTMNAAPDTLM